MDEMYQTNNLSLAGFLLAKNLTLRNTKIEDRKVFFLFDAVEDIPVLVDGYFSNDQVPVLSYWNHIKNLKSLVHQMLGN